MKGHALLWWLPLLVLLLVLQSTVLPTLAPRGLIPGPVLVLLVCTGLRWGHVPGAGLGLVAGLLLDFIGSGWFGVNALTLMLAGFLSGLVSQQETQDPVFLPAAATFLATLVHEPVSAVLFWAWEGTGPANWLVLWAALVPLSVVNALLSVALVRPFLWWERRQERQYRSLFRLSR